MLRIKALASNLVIVKLIKESEQVQNGLFLPNQRGVYAKAEVVELSPLRANPIFEDLKIGDIVLVEHEHMDACRTIPKGFTFNEPKIEFKVIEEYLIRMVVEEVPEPQDEGDGKGISLQK